MRPKLSYRPIRVLLVGPSAPPYAGIEASTETLVWALERCSSIEWRHCDSRKPVAIADRGHLNLANLYWTMRHALRVARACWSFRPDLVHIPIAHNRLGFLRDACFVLVARALGARVLLHAHNDSYEKFALAQPGVLREFIRWTYRQASAIVVQGDALRGQFACLGLGDRIRVLTNHVDVRAFAEARHARSSDGVYTVLLLGRVSFAKGAWDLAQAGVDAARRLGKPIRLALAGETVRSDRSVSHLQERSTDVPWLISRLLASAGDKLLEVKYLGILDRNAKVRAVADADVLALPSYSEALPHAILEGAAAGLPIIATSVGMIPELYQRGLKGVQVAPGDVNALSDALVALADPGLRRAAGIANVHFAASEHDLSLLPDRLMELYRSVMGFGNGIPSGP